MISVEITDPELSAIVEHFDNRLDSIENSIEEIKKMLSGQEPKTIPNSFIKDTNSLKDAIKQISHHGVIPEYGYKKKYESKYVGYKSGTAKKAKSSAKKYKTESW